MSDICISCGKNRVNQVLDLGMMPVDNISKKSASHAFNHPYLFGVCENCGVAQFINPAPEDKIDLLYEGTRFNEPESHLDNLAMLANSLFEKPGIIKGVSFKDESFIRRMENYGWTKNEEKPDIIIARSILEHKRDPAGFVSGCLERINNNGFLIIDVPGCAPMFALSLHYFLWQAHSLYFTAASLENFLALNGFNLQKLIEYQISGYETSIVAIIKKTGTFKNADLSGIRQNITRQKIKDECKKAEEFGRSFLDAKMTVQNAFFDMAKLPKSLLGTGHIAMNFINFYDLVPQFSAILDDNADKQGKCWNNCNLPVQSSEWLKHNPDAVCFLGINPASHNRLFSANSFFKHGLWKSIYDFPLNAKINSGI